MRISDEIADAAVVGELGDRISRVRLEKNLTQAELASEAGIHRNTIDRFESGQSISLTNFVRILRALELLSGLEDLLAEPAPSPIDLLRLSGKKRQRARSARAEASDKTESRVWTWGEDETKP